MNKITKIFTLVILGLILSLSVKAQVVEILKVSFPEYYNGNLKITSDKKYESSMKNDYRTLYFKLNDAISDVDGFKLNGVNNKANNKVLNFDMLKQLGKQDNLDSLIIMIKEDQKEINDFIKWDEKLAADSLSIAVYWTSFSDNYKQGNMDKAYPYWQILFNNYPIFHSSIYSSGVNILKSKIDNTKDSLKRQNYIDSLFIVLDQQVRAYPTQAAYSKGLKGFYFYQYYVKDKNLDDTIVRKNILKDYQLCNDAIMIGKENTPYFVFPVALKMSLFLAQLHKQDSVKFALSPDDFLNDYLNYSDLLNLQYQNEKDPKKQDAIKTQGMNFIDNIFTASDFSTCVNLVAIFTPKFDQSKNNINELKKIITLLGKKNCVETDLYEQAIEALYVLEPSAKSAQSIGQLLSYKNKFEEAAKYYDEAIDKETVDSVKGRYYFEAAKIYNQLNQYSKARDYCRKAIQLNPNDGKPYLLIATMYISTAKSVGSDAFDHSCVYWVAADKAQQGKNVDPSITTDADKLISSCAAHFPTKEEAFMHSVYEGSSYTVGGWIGETTTARFNK